MTYNKIFVDSDVLLDLLLQREPFYLHSQRLFDTGKEKDLKLYTSTLILANVHYLVAKLTNKMIAKDSIRTLSKLLDMLPFDKESLLLTLNSDHVDFEDTIQFYIAEKQECDLIISRNIKHFKKFTIPVLTAEQFLRIL